jgi:hypothetical protein
MNMGPPNVYHSITNNLGYSSVHLTSPNEDWDDFIAGHGPYVQHTTLGEHNNQDPFLGFDIPFWFEEENHWDMLR